MLEYIEVKKQEILQYIFRAYSRKLGHACGIHKRERSPIKGHNSGFLPLIFPNLGHLECYTPVDNMHFWSF